jgi:hypothetical protein
MSQNQKSTQNSNPTDTGEDPNSLLCFFLHLTYIWLPP